MNLSASELFYIAITAALIVIPVIIWLVLFFRDFSEDVKFLKLERGRACTEKEWKYWDRKLKRLYLSLIPFYRRWRKK